MSFQDFKKVKVVINDNDFIVHIFLLSLTKRLHGSKKKALSMERFNKEKLPDSSLIYFGLLFQWLLSQKGPCQNGMVYFKWYMDPVSKYHICQIGTIAKMDQIHKNVTASNYSTLIQLITLRLFVIFLGIHISAWLLLMYGQKGAFFKGLAAGSQRTQRNVFNIPRLP